jgi:hypothetical protein
MRTVLLIIILTIFTACNEYSEVTKPLRGIAGNCYCRYLEAVKHLYKCELSENVSNGMPPNVAKMEAVRVTNEWVRDVQLKEARNKRMRCDCLDIAIRNK